ncbi:hypothetical protein [Thermococcus waiotapuensis]|uniref:Uncharacterized protein n=1 Tax=Thermococcus waiotapuensis TaxID=90909 RepID=A0AAE4NXY9_9EURY|nr:hypothetical protein [Thermococcus waiotapuensis]MDV3104745.1 hypothetical protein [Thermococcus waiotapuensis]
MRVKGEDTMRKVYVASVVMTALSLFWPVLYGNIAILRRIPGNPALQAVAGMLVFGSMAYFTYEEEMREEFTAS